MKRIKPIQFLICTLIVTAAVLVPIRNTLTIVLADTNQYNALIVEEYTNQYIFDEQKVSARVGETVMLNLYIQNQEGERIPAASTVIIIYDSDKRITDLKVKTNSKGAAAFLFNKTGIYYACTVENENISEPDLCQITIKKPSVKFEHQSETLKMQTGFNKAASKKLPVKINGKYVDASELKWTIGNKKIADIKNGIITAKKKGSTVVYASIYNTTTKCKIHILDKRKQIVIDPGHQAHPDSSLEPLAPGSKEMKMKVSSGAFGKYSGSEYQLNLTVAKKLRKALLKRNYRVLMTRTTNDVNISNRERAEIANKANADAFIRIHANGSESASVNGIITICPTKSNPYCKAIYKKSRKLSDVILQNMKDKTGTSSGYIWETDTMTGINWCRIPVTIVELGFQSNPAEDRKLATDSYQNKLVNGITDGLNEYFDKS